MDLPVDYVIPAQRDKARYKMHKYWAGKPWYVVANYIRHFTREGDIVLDPFCGKGVVGCEALIHRRKAVLRDINPMATFISDSICTSPVDLEKLQRAFEGLRDRVGGEIMEMYRLPNPCPQCGGAVYAKHVIRGPALKGDWVVEARCENSHGRSGHFRRKLSLEEKEQILFLESQRIPYWFPDCEIPYGRETKRLINADIVRLDQLFTRRNLRALSMIYHEICKIIDPDVRQLLTLGFSNTLLHASKLKSERLRPMSANSYYCMGDWIEENVWQRFENRITWRWGILKGKGETNELIGSFYRRAESFHQLVEDDRTILIETGPAQDLGGIPDESVDYIFTDPPYGGVIQYHELTMLWRAWLGMTDGFIGDEITVNEYQQKGHESFEEMLSRAFSETYRVLKPKKWLTVTFNHRDPTIWSALLKACESAGFILMNVVPQDPLGNSFVQSWAGNALKRDLILNFRKVPKNHIALPTSEPKEEELDARSIVVNSARNYLEEKGKATLPELFEVAISHWLTAFYRRRHSELGELGVFSPDDAFDMAFVDECLSAEEDCLRRESDGGVFYERLW